MKVLFQATCLKCHGRMAMADTSDYEDTFHCENCNFSVEVRAR